MAHYWRLSCNQAAVATSWQCACYTIIRVYGNVADMQSARPGDHKQGAAQLAFDKLS